MPNNYHFLTYNISHYPPCHLLMLRQSHACYHNSSIHESEMGETVPVPDVIVNHLPQPSDNSWGLI